MFNIFLKRTDNKFVIVQYIFFIVLCIMYIKYKFQVYLMRIIVKTKERITTTTISLNIIFGANRPSHMPKIPVYRFGLYGRYQILCTNIAHFQCRPAMANISLLAKFEVRISFRSNAIVITTDGQTDRHSSNVLER